MQIGQKHFTRFKEFYCFKQLKCLQRIHSVSLKAVMEQEKVETSHRQLEEDLKVTVNRSVT